MAAVEQTRGALQQEQRSMIDHTSLSVSGYEESKRFYQAALKPLGYELLIELKDEKTGAVIGAGFGIPPRADFWIGPGPAQAPPVHIAFRAESRGVVDAFHAAALAAGGRDNGPPGLRPHYHASYYGAFVLDPDGNNIEAVCHTPA
jgi:catechol 2,3-dioxygenase-like lactoylglutathione lyase family enzyme